MSFLKKLVRDGLSGVTQSATNIARTKMGETVAPQQARRTLPSGQPHATQSGGMLEGAFASLLGSAERFIDNAGRMFSVCPNCQTAAIANTACETCGTQVPPAQTQSPAGIEANAATPSAQPTNCNNCGATVRGAVCEYCDSRTR